MGIESPQPQPEWIQALVKDVADNLRPLGFIGQLGFRYLSPDQPQNLTQQWVIGVYLIPHELAGGKYDGANAISGFCLNIAGLLALFSEVSTLEWRVPRSYNDGLAGPEVWLEGIYREEQQVQLHVYADPPSDELPSLVLDVTTNTLRVK